MGEALPVPVLANPGAHWQLAHGAELPAPYCPLGHGTQDPAGVVAPATDEADPLAHVQSTHALAEKVLEYRPVGHELRTPARQKEPGSHAENEVRVAAAPSAGVL